MAFRKILFVCNGNSCSSPMAQAVMQNLMIKTSLYWEIDSAGLRSWNAGRRPHKRCLRVLKEHGLKTDHYTRLLTLQDFRYFDYIIAMSMNVYKELLIWAAQNRSTKQCEISVLGWFGKNGHECVLPDLAPTTKIGQFRNAYYLIKDCCKSFLSNQRIRFIRYEAASSESESTGDESYSEAYRKHNERLELEEQLAKGIEL